MDLLRSFSNHIQNCAGTIISNVRDVADYNGMVLILSKYLVFKFIICFLSMLVYEKFTHFSKT